MAGAASYTCTEATLHTQTNAQTIALGLPVQVQIIPVGQAMRGDIAPALVDGPPPDGISIWPARQNNWFKNGATVFLGFTGDAMKVENVLQTIGNTPHIRINQSVWRGGANGWVKSERSNPGGSIRDRIALSMVEDAEKSRARCSPGYHHRATSGNTGIGLRWWPASRATS